MASLLTPTQIFKDLIITEPIESQDIKVTNENGFRREELYLLGRTVSDGQVKIYTVIEKPDDGKREHNAVIIIGNVKKGVSYSLIREFTKKGYMAIGIDLSGEGEGLHTEYPESLAHARFSNSVHDKTSLEVSVHQTCWFEWDYALKTLFSYLGERQEITKLAIVGVDDGAVPVWHVIASGEKVSGAIICSNAGWKGYEDNYKFMKNPEPNFSDEQFSYLAGVEPQAYAMHVKCPLYLLLPTNSPKYECDRGYDTISRIDAKVFTAINYSVGSRNTIDNLTFNGAFKFLEEAFNRTGNKKIALADEVEVSLIDSQNLRFEVSVKTEGLKNLELYIAESVAKPSLRCFKCYTGATMQKANKYVFDINNDKINGDFIYFAKASYENDYAICSMINYAESKSQSLIPKQKVLFSSREENAERAFYPLLDESEKDLGVQLDSSNVIRLTQGPKSMYGVTAKGGLVSFIVNEERGKAYEGAMLMLDAFIKDGGILSVKLVTDYFGARTEYFYQVKILSGKNWQNVKIMQKDFKTIEGMSLKDYSSLEAIEITLANEDKEFAINNLIWV